MQELIVAVVVACACWFTLRRYLPLPIRSAIAQHTANLFMRLGWIVLATRLRESTMNTSAAKACGGCSGCSQGSPSQSPQAKGTITPDALKNTIRR